MNDALLECPHCKGQFPLTETLARPLLQAARAEHAQADASRAANLTRREDEMRAREGHLASQRRCLAEQVEARVAQSLPEVQAAERQKLAAKFEAELAALREDLTAKNAALNQARTQELELRRIRQDLEDKQATLELTVQRRLDAERQKVRETAAADAAEQQRLKLAEKDYIIEAMKKDLEKARRTSEQGSQQVQGDTLEADLATILGRTFPRDEFTRTAKGHNGADVLQRVKGAREQDCGAILWECKRTAAWSESWLSKLRDHLRNEQACLAVIVTTAMPKGIEHFGERDGVWVASPTFAPHLAILLRVQLIELAQARATLTGKQDKASLLYEYLTGPQFRQRVEAIVESFSDMQRDLEAEKRQFTARWNKREKQIQRMLTNTCGLYGDVQGISGAGMLDLSPLPERRDEGPKLPAA